jgi:chromosome segregation ATPase
MSDDIENQNEEEMEEEIIMDQEEGGEGQDVYAFDMQINDDAYLIIIGKTDENKIFLRLMDKEDQSKPFFHGEFSLEDLRIINPIFNGIDSEDIAFQYLASNLNEAEKNIKIIDDEKIQFNLIITDEEDKFEFDFILIKNIDDGTGENENENEGENEMEEGVEQMINEVNEINDMNEINEVNELNEGNDIMEKNTPSQVENKKPKDENKINENVNPNMNQAKIEKDKKEILISNPSNENGEENMNGMKDELLKIINSLSDNFNNQIMKQNKAFDSMKEDLAKQSDAKINQMKDELNKKDNEIIELKNTINNLKQKLDDYESKLKDVNIKFDNIKIDNIKPLPNSSKKNEQNNNDGNLDNNKIMNEVKNNLKGFDNKISEVKNIFENNKKDNDNIIKNLTEKINNLDKNLQKNKTKENDNTKISSIEKGLKALDDKINTYEFDQLIENIAILMEKQNDNKIYEMINKLETQISDIKQKLNKRDSLESSKNKNKFDPELINKINNHENLITKLQTKLNKIQDEKQIDNSSKNKLSDIEKQSNDLKSKVDSLITLTKKLENNNKELNSKTNDLSNKFSQISVVPNPQFQSRKISNPKTKYYRTIENQNINQEMSYYNRTNPNINTNLNLSKDSFNSKIVNFSDITFLQNRIMQINPKIREVFFSLVYRASEDGDKAANFHQKCDRIGPNVVLIKTKKGSVFGGFTFRNWEHLARDTDVNRPNLGSASRDSNAFGFNVNKQKIYNNEKPNEFAIWCNRNFGPTFKNNLFQIFDHSLKKGGYCNLRKNSNFGGQLFDYEISGGEPKFKIDELEVFEVKLL